MRKHNINIQPSMLRFGAPLTGIGRWSGFSRFLLVGLLLLSGWTFAQAAAFTPSTTSGEAPLTVDFSDESNEPLDYARSWDFGDGSTSTSPSPQHTYQKPGNYSVVLTVSGNGGESESTSIIKVLASAALAWQAVPDTRVAGYDVHYGTASQTYGSVVSTSTNSATVPGLEFGRTYYFAVKSRGLSSSLVSDFSDEVSATVGVAAPEAAFRSSVTQGVGPLPVQFTDQSTGQVSAWHWTFGDGDSSTSRSPEHVYQSPGEYQVVLRVNGPGGATLSSVTNIKVLAPPPVANFTQSATSGSAPLSVDFADESTGGPVTSYLWTFEDGKSSTSQSPTHVFTAPGSYNVVLTVTGPGGTSSKTGATTTVSVPPPVAGFTQTPASGTAPLDVAFTDTSTGSINTYLWTFDGNNTSTLKSPTHKYVAAGDYIVSLMVTGDGGTSTKTGVVKVLPPKPVASFIENVTSGKAPLTVHFSATATGTSDSYDWLFGDDGFSTGKEAVYTYTKAGTYSVSLTVNGPGGTDTLTKTDLITVEDTELPPVANFSADELVGDAPLTVNFKDLTTGNATQHAWEFGDKETSNVSNPVHVYANPGSYTVKLTATGPGGSNVMEKVAFITVRAPTGGPGGLAVESGTLSVDSNWTSVAFNKPFTDPIVVASALSFNNAEPAVVRIDGITKDGFRIRVQRWDYLVDKVHPAETVHFLVVERGRHQLPSGAWIEAGRLNATGGSRWDLQSFKSPFGVNPVLFTSIVSANDPTAVTTRLRQVQAGSFQLRLQKQESIMNRHGSESVNWIAWQPSSGTVDGLKFRVGKTASSVTNLPFTLSFRAGLSATPVFLSSIQTVGSIDTVVLRWSDLNANGVKAWVQEEQSLDAEVTHPGESMGWAVFE